MRGIPRPARLGKQRVPFPRGLLLAGARDRRVPAEQSFELFDLLRMAGRPAELVEYRSHGHNLWGGNPESDEHIAGRIADFLARHLAAERRDRATDRPRDR